MGHGFTQQELRDIFNLTLTGRRTAEPLPRRMRADRLLGPPGPLRHS